MKPVPFTTHRCRDCGTPLFARCFRSWNDDGTVTARFTGDIRICQIETELLDAIFDGLADRIGYPVDRIAIEGQRKAMRRLTEDFFAIGHGLSGAIGRTRTGSRLVARLTVGVAWTVGHALPEDLLYDPGHRFHVRMYKPYSWQLMVGDVWGGFEALHNVTAEAHWEMDGDSLVIEVEKTGDSMVWEDPSRLQLRRMGRLQSDAAYERCGRCGVPLEVPRETEWDIRNGLARNKVTGRREATILVEPLNAMLRELEGELGDEIPIMVQQIATEHTARNIPPGVADLLRELGYRRALEHLRASGMGNPVSVETRNGELTVRVDNPYSGLLVAGAVAGVYQAIEEEEPETWWALDPRGFMIAKASAKRR
jgi:hypothetical protein